MPCGTQEVVEDLQNGSNVPSWPPAAILAVGVQRAYGAQSALVSAQW